MQSLWNDSEAAKFSDSELNLRVYSSRLLGQNADLVLHGGGNTSLKARVADIFGEQQDILYIKGSGHDLKTMGAEGYAPVKLGVLKKLATLPNISDAQMVSEMRAALTNPNAPTPSIEAILHAVIPLKYVDHTHADAVVALSNTPNGEKILNEIYGAAVLILPYIMPGFILSKQVGDAVARLDLKKCGGIILLHHGVISFGETAKESYERMIKIVSQAEDYLAKHAVCHPEQGEGSPDKPKEILRYAQDDKRQFNALEFAKLRRAVGIAAGQAFIAKFKDDEKSVSFACLSDARKIATRGPLTPDHVIHTKRAALIVENDAQRDVADFAEAYAAYFKKNNDKNLKELDRAPRWAVIKNCGLASFAVSNKTAGVISDIIDHTIKAISWGEALGGWQALPEKNIFDIEYWELEQAKLKKNSGAKGFEGKVVLVTGAASGIGKASCEEFLNQNACVVGLDLNECSVRHANFLPVRCDVTNAQQINTAIVSAVKAFGGIDMLVSNAGSFPKSQKIEEISDENFARVVELNMTSHLKVVRALVPFLKLGFDPAVVIVASKNVPAPGPGAAAYSMAKAGLTQLARVAALELGPHGIRVNTIHPHGVFDTGIWTTDVIAGRAKSYNMSAEDYKKHNILGVEIHSKDVARLITTLCSEAFAKTTGAQIPLDGGNERVI